MRARHRNVGGKAVPPGGAVPSWAGRSGVPSGSHVKVKIRLQVHLAESSVPLPVLRFKSEACLLTRVVKSSPTAILMT